MGDISQGPRSPMRQCDGAGYRDGTMYCLPHRKRLPKLKNMLVHMIADSSIAHLVVKSVLRSKEHSSFG